MFYEIDTYETDCDFFCKQIQGVTSIKAMKHLKNLCTIFIKTTQAMTDNNYKFNWIHRIDNNGDLIEWGSYGLENDQLGWKIVEINQKYVAIHIKNNE